MNKALLSSKNYDWSTPQAFFDKMNDEFQFDVDVCALPHNTKCDKYFTPEIDGLSQEWEAGKTYWMNPPYGRQIKNWIKKAYDSSQKGAVVVCLIPSRTDTSYWHDYCMKGEVRFIRGRLYFEREGKSDRAPFPSAVVIFREGQQYISSSYSPI